MKADGRRWRVRLAAVAEEDFRNILRWTAERFGETQPRLYAETLTRAVETLTAGPRVPGSQGRDEIAEVWSLMTLFTSKPDRLTGVFPFIPA